MRQHSRHSNEFAANATIASSVRTVTRTGDTAIPPQNPRIFRQYPAIALPVRAMMVAERSTAAVGATDHVQEGGTECALIDRRSLMGVSDRSFLA